MIDEYMWIEFVLMDERLKVVVFEIVVENGIGCEEMVSGVGYDV